MHERQTARHQLPAQPAVPALGTRHHRSFGGIVALDRISFDVDKAHHRPDRAERRRQRPLFNCLSRLYNYSEGSITFEASAGRVPRTRWRDWA